MPQKERMSQLPNSGVNPSAIVVYLNGFECKPGKHEWIGDLATHLTINDSIFVSELPDHVQERYFVDGSRVYATGKSNGGGLTNALACNTGMSKCIAVFAPVSQPYIQILRSHVGLAEGKCSFSNFMGKVTRRSDTEVARATPIEARHCRYQCIHVMGSEKWLYRSRDIYNSRLEEARWLELCQQT